MALDGIKGTLSNLASTAQKKLEEVVKPPTPSAPQPAAAKPAEGFTDAKQKLMSITGKAAKFVPTDAPKPELAASVAKLRSMANAGMFVGSVQGQSCAEGDVAALKKAVADGSDVRIRELVNGDPALAKQLTPEEKGKALETLRSGVCTDADEKAMVAIVKSCDTKRELRFVVMTAAGKEGGFKHEDVYRLDKEMTGHHPYLIADLLNPDNKSLPDDVTADAITRSQITDLNSLPTADPNEKTGLGPADAAARRKFLEGLTQVDANRKTDPAHTDGCSALCIVASAMQNDDPKGAMAKLCDYNLKNMSARKDASGAEFPLEERKKQLTELKARIEKGEPISKADANLLQECTYNTLQTRESKLEGVDNTNRMVHEDAVKTFLDDAGIGTSGGVPKRVDLDGRVHNKEGERSAEHFVLVRPDGEVYDPWPRKDGKQIVAAGTDEAAKYRKYTFD